MEHITEAIARHGNIWTLKTNNEMQELYEPLHAAKASSFQDLIKCEKGIKYGPSDRHRIDVCDKFYSLNRSLTSFRFTLQLQPLLLYLSPLSCSSMVAGLLVATMILLLRCMGISVNIFLQSRNLYCLSNYVQAIILPAITLFVFWQHIEFFLKRAIHQGPKISLMP